MSLRSVLKLELDIDSHVWQLRSTKTALYHTNSRIALWVSVALRMYCGEFAVISSFPTFHYLCYCNVFTLLEYMLEPPASIKRNWDSRDSNFTYHDEKKVYSKLDSHDRTSESNLVRVDMIYTP